MPRRLGVILSHQMNTSMRLCYIFDLFIFWESYCSTLEPTDTFFPFVTSTMKVVFFSPSLILLLSMCVYWVQLAPILENKTDIHNKDGPVTNEQSEHQNDSLKEEHKIQKSNDGMSVVIQEIQDILNEEEGFTSKSMEEKNIESIKPAIGNKTISENNEDSTTIEVEDIFSHMLRFLFSEDDNDNDKISRENEKTKTLKIKEDQTQSEDNNALKRKNSKNELISEQNEDINIREENNGENDEEQLTMENGTASENVEQVEILRENILILQEEIKSIQEEIELIKKENNSTVEYSESNEENETTDEADSSILDQIWNYFG